LKKGAPKTFGIFVRSGSSPQAKVKKSFLRRFFSKKRPLRQYRSRDAGFTLLEMLVALVVFGLVMAGLTQTFRYGLSVWSAGPRKIAEPEDLAALDAALTRMIAQMAPDKFTGLPDRLAFTTVLPVGAGLPTALADAAILTAPDGTLVMRYTPHPPGIPLTRPPPPRIEVLANGVTGFSASYLIPQANGAPVWARSWSGGGLPLLVRLHIALASGRDWPDLIAGPVRAGD
jgi:general secretion pathway protein J